MHTCQHWDFIITDLFIYLNAVIAVACFWASRALRLSTFVMLVLLTILCVIHLIGVVYFTKGKALTYAALPYVWVSLLLFGLIYTLTFTLLASPPSLSRWTIFKSLRYYSTSTPCLIGVCHLIEWLPIPDVTANALFTGGEQLTHTLTTFFLFPGRNRRVDRYVVIAWLHIIHGLWSHIT